MFRSIPKSLLFPAVLMGILAGVGLYTFKYAEGLSYFSSDPAACINCHIMNEEFDAWTKASHHAHATCVECHLPHEFVPKMLAKADNGWHHSTAFTFQNFHEPIMIKPRNSQILQDNCLRCHGDFVHDIVSVASGDIDFVRCVHCHSSVGHGPLK